MKAFTQLDGLVVPLDRANVDTDAILPKQFLKSIRRIGFGVNLFDEWRYLDHGEPGQDCSTRPLNAEFPLNMPRYRGAQILLARENFGCGSSREHAPWALAEYGFRAIVAPSFAQIFYGNCLKNGVLPIVLPPEQVEALFVACEALPGYRLSIDLPAQVLVTPDGRRYCFDIDAFQKQCLLEGLDEIGLSLQRADRIRDYEQQRRLLEPWLFGA